MHISLPNLKISLLTYSDNSKEVFSMAHYITAISFTLSGAFLAVA